MTILATVGEKERSDAIVSLGYDLATTYGEDLVVLHVIPDEEFDEHRQAVEQAHDFPNLSFRQEEDSAARFARRVAEDVLGDYDEDVIEARGRVGDPADEILAEADSVDARFVVIGGRRRSPVGKALFGSTTQEILLNATRPVVTSMVD